MDLAGLDDRSIESLATSEPNRFVMPRSSSFTRPPPVCGHHTGAQRGSTGVRCSPAGAVVPPSSVIDPVRGQGHLGWLGEVILIVPETMPALILASSAFVLAGTLESKLWNGARPVPPLSRVPM